MNKLWFDSKCEKKRDVIKNSFKEKSSNPSDRQLKEKFNKKLKENKKYVEQRKSMFWNNNLNNLKITCSNLTPHFGTIGRISLNTKRVLILR